MNVAFFHHTSDLYGASRSLINLIDGLKKRGVSPHVFLIEDGPIVTELCNRNIPFEFVPFRWWVHERLPPNTSPIETLKFKNSLVFKLIRNFTCIPLIVKIINKWKIDLLYTNTLVLPIGSMVAKFNSIPHIWHIREFGDLDYGFGFDWGIKRTKHAINNASAIITISNAVREAFVQSEALYKHTTVYNGVAWEKDMQIFKKNSKSRERHNLDNEYQFSIVGQIHPAKGQLEAIEALSIVSRTYPNVRLNIVGFGQEKYILPCIEKTRELDVIDKINFSGFIADPYEVYIQSDAVLMCSRREALGRVTMEAMSAAKPIIGRASGGTLELIDDNENGLLYDGGSDELAKCMMKFVEMPEWAREMGERGWLKATENFTIERYSEKIHRVMTRLI